jgi:hypothetical protein
MFTYVKHRITVLYIYLSYSVFAFKKDLWQNVNVGVGFAAEHISLTFHFSFCVLEWLKSFGMKHNESFIDIGC